MGANKTYMSVFGMYRYDNTILDDLHVPAGIDKDALIDNILLDTAELECVYPDIEFFKNAVDRWSAKELPIWQKLLETTQFEYNPIWNKDGSVVETETRNLTVSGSGSNHAETEGESNTSQNQDTTLKVSAYNSDDFENREHTGVDNEVDVTDSVESDGSYNSTQHDTGTVKHERVEKGNIGVTTTQQMIKEEREVVQFNVVNYIVNSFKNRFCILVY